MTRKPSWLRFSLPGGREYTRVKGILAGEKLNTVCLEAHCPNIGECFSRGTATFLIMGRTCTRNCRYCSIATGTPEAPDTLEPLRVARAALAMGLSHAVITSVTRDDLADGGASFFVTTVQEIRARAPQCTIEILVPDFGTSMNESLDAVIDAAPDVINHNIEVVKNLFADLRPGGDYRRSLDLMGRASASSLPVKSGLMIGFGESMDDIAATLDDLARAGCSIVTVGQYLQSSASGVAPAKYYHPDEFAGIADMARCRGIATVLSGPLVRSSYHADTIAAQRCSR